LHSVLRIGGTTTLTIQLPVFAKSQHFNYWLLTIDCRHFRDLIIALREEGWANAYTIVTYV
jgi:hypothetical protein